ncbi:50S ribosomal protein L15 [Acanthopleuribacter pedis]|uniref:Large ribosomal subunit protein uL15 n=1 Tax=Acanthopleuribacter pedis TaxID=442870 RepID=A0A8J7U613_9BACT|nr:50S ribosomal protein L15 [Acanthopleuribacter pedis]MBO1322292.1 50S ribosomal protein L15 [Acanthopleuribacter pedis]
MKLNELRPNDGATRNKKRVGRGPGSGNGKTAGRGHKGQKSRSGYSRKRGFEGGQMPLQRRLPKRGFKNIFRKEWVVLNVSMFENRDVSEVTLEDYRKLGLIKNTRDGVKILGDGELTKAITFHAHKFSKSAQEKIEKAGGKCVVIEG